MSIEYFVCTVNVDGYEFQDMPDESKDDGIQYRVLVPRRTGSIQKSRIFPLFEQTPAWDKFANLSLTEKSILAFAGRFGHLFPRSGVMARKLSENCASNQKEPEKTIFVWHHNAAEVGELLEAWLQAIRDMKHFFDIWVLLRNEDTSGLSAYLHQLTPNRREWIYAEDPQSVERLQPSGRLVVRKHDPNLKFKKIELPENIENPTIEHAARHLLLESLNERLAHMRLNVLWDATKPLSWHLDLMIVPESLLDALWLQFSKAVTRNIEIRQCENKKCKKWFVLGYKNVKKRKWCGDACRKAIHRSGKA